MHSSRASVLELSFSNWFFTSSQIRSGLTLHAPNLSIFSDTIDS